VAPWLAECAALLHDVGRTLPGPESEHGQRSAELSAPLLVALRPALGGDDVDQILYAVRWHNSTRDDTRLLCVLRDADMLDGLGAVGLTRALTSKAALPPYDERGVMLGGHYLRPPRSIADQINFQIAWIDFLNTETARELARERIAFMWAFLEQWQRELK
jgi:HD superfamily phosphodiesterase